MNKSGATSAKVSWEQISLFLKRHVHKANKPNFDREITVSRETALSVQPQTIAAAFASLAETCLIPRAIARLSAINYVIQAGSSPKV